MVLLSDTYVSTFVPLWLQFNIDTSLLAQYVMN